MNEEVLDTTISKYLKYRFKESIFGWQGGEPTLMGLDFFKKVVKFQQKHGKSGQIIGNALQTNGILINENWGEFLSKYRFLVGLSLDGPKEIHDKYRRSKGGKSVWNKVMRAAKILEKFNVNFNILCVLSRANINQAKKIYDFFIENGFRHIQFIPAMELDENGEVAQFCITPKQYGKFLIEIFKIWIKNPQEMQIRIFNAILAYILNQKKGYCTLEKQCADYLVIEWNGDVYPCDFFVNEKYKLGNITTESFSELKQNKNKHFMNLKRNYAKECEECKWLELCHGGCVKDRKIKGKGLDNKTYFCEGYKLFFETAYESFLKYVRVLKNQGIL